MFLPSRSTVRELQDRCRSLSALVTREITYGTFNGDEPLISRVNQLADKIDELRRELDAHLRDPIWRLHHALRLRDTVKRGFEEADSMYKLVLVTMAQTSMANGAIKVQHARERRLELERRRDEIMVQRAKDHEELKELVRRRLELPVQG
jgi:hypothetical protein